ncbi:hypothetical protein [Magnetospirillum sp. UT-4]|uniref:hypothetical protein n=1 Tax=Magnetospirillum sp. UT-4 TaxID=2681467 RepID=UPI00137E6573|nr:hypothetical protein [Magnetospirillum sp. UT-4]CAA7613199.1 conserved exported hypothetical protein [Magnetospirillum sp. UT-4]
MRRAVLLASCLLLLALPAAAQDLPQFPKAGPPEPLPEAPCDTALANNGEWLLGRWVSPQSRWEFTRKDGAILWSLDRKGSAAGDFGWYESTRIDGRVDKVTGCTVAMTAGQGAFVFEGVLTDPGKLFGFATNAKGAHVRFTLRRER